MSAEVSNPQLTFGLPGTPEPKRPMWQLGPRGIALAAMAGNWTILLRRPKQAMEEFVRSIGYTVHLAIFHSSEVVSIDNSESARHLTVSSGIGLRRAVNVTALDKCLLPFDPEAAVSLSTTKNATSPCVAPLRDTQGYVVAAISVSALTSRAEYLDFKRLAEEVRALADRISQNTPATA